MKATAIIKGVTSQFWKGFGTTIGSIYAYQVWADWSSEDDAK